MNKIIENDGKIINLSDGTKLRTNCYDVYNKPTWEVDTKVDLIQVNDLFWPMKLINLNDSRHIRVRPWYGDELIPKSKFDFDTVSKLEMTSAEVVEPILPELFEWTEDVNWPIAPQLAKTLSKFGDIIIPYVIYYLNHPCGLDEYGTYYYLMPNLANEQLVQLKDVLMKIAESPSEFQKEQEYDEFALSYLAKL